MRTTNILSSKAKVKASLAFILLAMLTLSSCGKRKPPLPPVEKVFQSIELSGFQRGERIVLSWAMPARNAPERSILNINRADIYRLAENGNINQSISEEEFASRSILIASLSISADDFNLKKLTYSDILEFANQPVSLRYAVRFVNQSGQKAGFSNLLLIEPAAQVADKPTSLKTDLTEAAINLSWLKPEKNINGSEPVNIFGYNIYRSDSAQAAASLLNEKPVSDNKFSDRNYQFGKEYFYFVRSVAVGANGELVESGESNIQSIIPKDVFPPGAPNAITIAASPNILSIFFAVNPEKDIAGYRIYRSENLQLEKSQWKLITSDLSVSNTFQDKNVEAGKTYYYYLTAVDQAGNVSEPSEIISETAL